jgi:glycosyltransferase involved in cell wall biosynthesis
MAEKQKSYFLAVSRLVPYKKVDLVIKVFNQTSHTLVIVGTGSEENKLKQMANKNIKFVGQVTDEELKNYYKDCIALIFPQEEDFGLVAIEALQHGKPVIAYKKGGALDIIKDGINGVFFDEQSPKALRKAIDRLFTMKFNSDIIVSTSSRFGKARFKRELLKVIKNG